uniref:SRY protein n=1 Tax=Phoenix dactylifera TaxID=42345 RepID=A0A0N7AVI9_PHODC|nr:SRY protein [Phoenix dactylifera]
MALEIPQCDTLRSPIDWDTGDKMLTGAKGWTFFPEVQRFQAMHINKCTSYKYPPPLKAKILPKTCSLLPAHPASLLCFEVQTGQQVSGGNGGNRVCIDFGDSNKLVGTLGLYNISFPL